LKPSCFRKALITGASSGIGWQLALLLSHQGIDLLLSGRDRQKLEEVGAEVRQRVQADLIVADLSDRNERQKLISLLHEQTPDLVINCAGYGIYGPAIDHPSAMQLDLIEVNLMAAVEITLEVARALMARNPTAMPTAHDKEAVILNVSSVAGYFSFPYLASYAAAKSALTSFSQALDRELRSSGIRILTALPGEVKSHFRERAALGHPQKRTGMEMSSESAAQAIWKQILKRKSLNVFDWRYKVGCFLATHLVPTSIMQRILRSNISKRYLHPPLLKRH
jgi:short-subunit dehydrogenase